MIAQIYNGPIPVVRTFPLTFTESGNVVYPQLAYPYRGWIISSKLAGVLCFCIPTAIFVISQIRLRSFWDFNNALSGLLCAVVISSFFQVVLKQYVGGFRPHFLDICKPDLALAASHNKSGLNGVGFRNIMYTTEICTQQDRSVLRAAMTGFPSGHASIAWASFGFLFLWLNAKLKVWSDYKPAFLTLFFTISPLLAATYICGSLTIDAAHSWYDIVGGSCIGIIMALAAYRAYYAALWDWRYNHLPLLPKETASYNFVREQKSGRTFTTSAGWGPLPKHQGVASGNDLQKTSSSEIRGRSRANRSPSLAVSSDANAGVERLYDGDMV
ncbi:hypothetical protein S7711_06746 [Stachybotrys chartarum IBT 7711]|uniref:Phosphatidic acid phosphatase type 2/haloperoxidase domain-containing protein n=1 Tax=Stachybotrys chartarum (strain CBS 109288 / IBT 7711) TaxID=1280523 RepID=A0A084B5T7_STACB|nr:hypothetical protein S7711_06746 [Stachybotrys chartarum IBT 7711]